MESPPVLAAPVRLSAMASLFPSSRLSGSAKTQSPDMAPKVAIVWRGDAQARRDATPETSRQKAVFEALARQGVAAEPCVFCEELAPEVREQLQRMDGVLVWVDPISAGQRRDELDEILRAVAAAGVVVSTHPDVILKMGVKEVLYATVSWAGSPTPTSTRPATPSRPSFPGDWRPAVHGF